MKENINILFTNIKKLVLKMRKIQRLLLNIQIIFRISVKILRITIKAEIVLY